MRHLPTSFTVFHTRQEAMIEYGPPCDNSPEAQIIVKDSRNEASNQGKRLRTERCVPRDRQES